MRFTLRFTSYVIFSLHVFPSNVLCDRRGLNHQNTVSPSSSTVGVVTNIPSAISVEEGALFGCSSAEECILGGGSANALWDVIPARRAEVQQLEQQDAVDDEDDNTTNNEAVMTARGFGSLPAFTSR